jgi:hypothetical protein
MRSRLGYRGTRTERDPVSARDTGGSPTGSQSGSAGHVGPLAIAWGRGVSRGGGIARIPIGRDHRAGRAHTLAVFPHFFLCGAAHLLKLGKHPSAALLDGLRPRSGLSLGCGARGDRPRCRKCGCRSRRRWDRYRRRGRRKCRSYRRRVPRRCSRYRRRAGLGGAESIGEDRGASAPDGRRLGDGLSRSGGGGDNHRGCLRHNGNRGRRCRRCDRGRRGLNHGLMALAWDGA